MAIEDLDLEFEDETEKSKGDALEVDIDLSFSASPEEEKRALMAKNVASRTPKPKADILENPKNIKPKPSGNVANINQARSKARVQQPSQVNQQASQDTYAKDSASEVEQLRQEIEMLKGQVQNIQHQASVKVAVAEAEKDFLIEYVSNAKVLDHQVTQILQRMGKKAPAISAEAQAVKRYMNEFLKKAIPKKKE